MVVDSPITKPFGCSDEYKKNGYCIVPYDIEKCIAIEKYIGQLDYGETTQNFVYSLLTFNSEINVEISKQVTCFFSKCLPEAGGNRFTTGSFLVKPGHVSSELQLHQDWTYSDYNDIAPVTCWAPLIDAGPNTGGIFLIKGSHNFFNSYRSNSYPTSRFGLAEIDNGALTFLEVKRGEILLFNPSLWHGSAVNTGSASRIAVTCLMIPENNKLLYFHKHEEHTCMVFELPEYGLETYLRNLVANEIPTALKLIKTIPYRHNISSATDLNRELTIL